MFCYIFSGNCLNMPRSFCWFMFFCSGNYNWKLVFLPAWDPLSGSKTCRTVENHCSRTFCQRGNVLNDHLTLHFTCWDSFIVIIWSTTSFHEASSPGRVILIVEWVFIVSPLSRRSFWLKNNRLVLSGCWFFCLLIHIWQFPKQELRPKSQKEEQQLGPKPSRQRWPPLDYKRCVFKMVAPFSPDPDWSHSSVSISDPCQRFFVLSWSCVIVYIY